MSIGGSQDLQSRGYRKLTQTSPAHYHKMASPEMADVNASSGEKCLKIA